MDEEESPQQALFDTSGKQYNVNFVDQNQPLFIPNNPLHWKAHKLQVLLSRLEKQSATNPAQFNSRTYIDTLSAYEDAIEKIKLKEDQNGMDSGEVATGGESPTAQEVGTRITLGMGNGVSADNPLAG